ncbi:MAG: hypothetical protein ABJI96_00500 [Paracoccaceae bacterium]
MKTQTTARYLLIATLCVVFPLRLETDESGKLILVAPYAHAKSGSGKDGDGGSSGSGGEDDGEGGDGESDNDGSEGGEGRNDGSEGSDDGESDNSGDGGERDDSGDEGESGESDDDSEGDDDDEGRNGDEPRPTKVEKLANGARIFFSDGSQEEIRDGQFVRTDPSGRVVDRRRARGSDLARMRALYGGQKTQSGIAQTTVNSRALKATYRGKNVEILYSNGWREEISSGRYKLIDQYGRAAASRRATQADRNRLNRFRK